MTAKRASCLILKKVQSQCTLKGLYKYPQFYFSPLHWQTVSYLFHGFVLMFSHFSISDTRRKESWSVSHTLTICKYWQKMWMLEDTVVTSPSCPLAPAVIKDSEHCVQVNEQHLLCLPTYKPYTQHFSFRKEIYRRATSHPCILNICVQWATTVLRLVYY